MTPLRILLLEDDPRDAGFIRDKLSASGLDCAIAWVKNGPDYLRALAEETFALILCGHTLVDREGGTAFRAARAAQPATPVILIANSLGEDEAVESLHRGATDYVLKQQLHRLPAAVRRAVEDAEKKRRLARSEADLRRSERLLADFFEQATIGLHWVGPDGRVLRVNQSELDLLGYSREDYLGHHIAEFHADAEVIATMLRRLAAGEALRNQPARLRCKDGAFKDVLIDANVLWEDGRFVHARSFTRDITESRRAEAERDRILNASVDPICVAGYDGYFKQLNHAWTKVLGWTTGELMSKPWAEFVHPEDRRASLEAKSTIEGGQPVYNFENRYLHRDGSYRWLQWKASPLPAGERVFAVARDVTESKRIEAEIALWKNRYEAVIKASGHILYDWDPASNEVVYGGDLERVLGYGAAEMTGGLARRRELLHPEDRDGFDREIARVIAGKLPFHLGYRIQRKDGGYIFAQDDGYFSFDARGDITRMLGFVVDITERKQLEIERDRIFNLSLDPLCVAGFDGYFKQLNPAWTTMLGRTVEELKSRPWMDFIHPDDHEVTRQSTIMLQQDRPVLNFENRYRHRDGSYRWLSWKALPLAAEHLIFAVARDVTERKQAEAERALLEGQLRQSQKMEAIGTLAGGIAHDFNNILAGITGYTSLAHTAAAGNAELGEYLGEIGRAAKRAADLVQQILAFSRAGDLKMEPMQWRHVVAESVKLLRAALPSTLEIETHLATDLPAILGNGTQLHQIMMNLGTNAAHAMRNRPGRLTIDLDASVADESLARAWPGFTPGPCVRLRVSDTGCGMDAKTLERSFEPFFTTKGPGEGTGLGLSVVHGIVLSHHGAVRLSSVAGQGTTFEIFLPAISASPATDERQSEEIPRGGGERILLVDDEPSLVKVGVYTLRKLGYIADGETQVMAALARVEREPASFDLVIADQTMPGMTGLEFAENVRNIRKDLPVILASGFSLALTDERIQSAGVREVLPKPYTIAGLAHTLRRHLPPRPVRESPSP